MSLLSDFTLSELSEEISDRLQDDAMKIMRQFDIDPDEYASGTDCSIEDYDTIDLIQELSDRGHEYPHDIDMIKNELKYDYFMEHLNDFTLEDLEKIIASK